jgi:hypothetical protein
MPNHPMQNYQICNCPNAISQLPTQPLTHSPVAQLKCATVRPVARGWESKAIESQQEDARAAGKVRPALTPAERERAERRGLLELAMAQAQAELQAACRPAHREMVRLKLDALKAELGTL